MSWLSESDTINKILSCISFPIDEKALINWIRKGREIALVKKGNRRGYDDLDILQWVERLKSSIILLDRSDYVKCLNFAVEGYYRKITKSDFNRAKQREFGEFITNQIEGKLGEIAVQKLLLNYGISTELDFNITGKIPSQDIIRVSTRTGVWNNPSCKISIKSTKLKNFLLTVTDNEIRLPDRTSDIYVLSLVGIFPNHIMRIIKGQNVKELKDIEGFIPDFESIICRVCGWISSEDLIASGLKDGTEIEKQYGIRMSSPNYIRLTGQLSWDWQSFADKLIGK